MQAIPTKDTYTKPPEFRESISFAHLTLKRKPDITFHKVRYEFCQGPYPASTLVQVAQLIDPDWLIEIEAIAVIPVDSAKREEHDE